MVVAQVSAISLQNIPGEFLRVDHLELKGASFGGYILARYCRCHVGGSGGRRFELARRCNKKKQCVAVLEGLPAVMVLEAEFAFRSMVHVNAVRPILHWPLQWCSRTD